MAKNKVKETKKADVKQEVEVYWKVYNDKTFLAIKVTKGSKTITILKEPKYLRSIRDHIQTVAKFGLRKNYI